MYKRNSLLICVNILFRAFQLLPLQMSANLGIPIGSSPTPPLPNFVPPLSIFLPWVIRACSLPRSYSGGRGTAYKLLCRMIIRHWHSLPSEAELAHFYRLMHNALQPDSVSALCVYLFTWLKSNIKSEGRVLSSGAKVFSCVAFQS